MGRLEPQILLVGPGVLSTITSQGKKSCLLSPVLGAALVKNPLEDVANKNLLRPRFSYGQSTQTWLLGPRGKTRQIRVNNFYEKALPSRENFWAGMNQAFGLVDSAPNKNDNSCEKKEIQHARTGDP